MTLKGDTGTVSNSNGSDDFVVGRRYRVIITTTLMENQRSFGNIALIAPVDNVNKNAT